MKHSEEHKRKIGLAHKGMKRPAETCRKIGLSKIGNKNCVGRIVSEETKQKMRAKKIGKKLSDEHKKRLSEAQKRIENKPPILRGDKNPKWKKDRNLIIGRKRTDDSGFVNWSKEIKKRDNWKCKMSNNDCNGQLQSHHILPWKQYPELRYELNNGITLCKFHHPLKKDEVEKLAGYFRRLISRKL